MNIPYSLILAVAAVESGGNPSAVGKHGELGLLQITQAVVDDCNRIQKAVRFEHQDALQPELAEAMFRIYVGYYGRGLATAIRMPINIRDMAMLWHYGPAGVMRHSAEADDYCDRVENLVAEYERKQPALNTLTGLDWRRMFARHRAGLEPNEVAAELRELVPNGGAR